MLAVKVWRLGGIVWRMMVLAVKVWRLGGIVEEDGVGGESVEARGNCRG